MYFVLMGVLVLLLSYFGVGAIRSWALRRNLLDVPNERSSHVNPTPRGGGLAIAVIVLAGCAVQLSRSNLTTKGVLGYLLGALLVAAISAVDDVFDISARVRLPVHLLAAGVFAA